MAFFLGFSISETLGPARARGRPAGEAAAAAATAPLDRRRRDVSGAALHAGSFLTLTPVQKNAKQGTLAGRSSIPRAR